MDIKDIQNLIKFVSKSDVSEVTYKTQDFEICIKTNNLNTPSHVVYTQPSQTIQSITPSSIAPVSSESNVPIKNTEEDTSKYVVIKSPMIGTFYRKPSPDKDVFVNVGDTVNAGSVVCVIEAMKLFNEIESEISGKIVKILVEDSSPVEFDQPLFLVDPS